MEKFSPEWYKKFKEMISEKYKYLFVTHLAKNYDIRDVKVEVDIVKNKIERLYLNIDLDYLGSCDGDAYSLSDMIKKISDDLRDTAYNFVLDNETFKFTKNKQDVLLSDILFYKFNYEIDEKHEANVSLYYDYNL